ncbi:MAG TPA: hypothetical protein VFN67_36335 [Polyangiales bacterium]|nr:hypothetical protein [Polyangiales bacterium]
MKTSALIPIIGVAGAALVGVAAVAASKSKAATPKQPAADGGARTYTPKEAAQYLYLYVTKPGVEWGSSASPNPIIEGAQRDMQQIKVDGIYGPETQKRGAALTMQPWPARPAATAAKPKPKAAPKPASNTIPSHTVTVTPAASSSASSTPAAKPAAKPAAPSPTQPPGATVDLPAQVVPEGRSPKQAAQALQAYVTPLIRSGRAAELGSKAKPNELIASLQRDMRGIASDGIYGPKTQARGKELLGVEFPARASSKLPAANVLNQPPPSPPSTETSEAARAAEGLLAYLSQPGADQGSKGKPSGYVKAAQAAMGALTADGIYGPATRARGAQLTGQTFPPRK